MSQWMEEKQLFRMHRENLAIAGTRSHLMRGLPVSKFVCVRKHGKVECGFH
jgi:hypothetical protein